MEIVEQIDTVTEVICKGYVKLTFLKDHIYHLYIGRVIGALIMKDITHKVCNELAFGGCVDSFKNKSDILGIGSGGRYGHSLNIAVNGSNIILLVGIVLGNYHKLTEQSMMRSPEKARVLR